MTTGGDYIDRLDAALATAGVRGARRRRIVAEFADHLACDPSADPASLGTPEGLAGQFADELGTSFARTAAFAAFAALALTGALVVIRLLAFGPFTNADGSAGDTVSLLATVLAGQISLVAGGLALVRAMRLRDAIAIPRAEASVLARRAAVGLAAGAVAILAVPVHGAAQPGGGPTGTPWLSYTAMGVALAAVVLAAPAVVRSLRLRPLAGGPAGDVLADLGPARPAVARLTHASATRLALLVALALVLVVTAAGLAADDPYDGALRGVVEGGAFLGCYGVLGRWLGLRS